MAARRRRPCTTPRWSSSTATARVTAPAPSSGCASRSARTSITGDTLCWRAAASSTARGDGGQAVCQIDYEPLVVPAAVPVGGCPVLGDVREPRRRVVGVLEPGFRRPDIPRRRRRGVPFRGSERRDHSAIPGRGVPGRSRAHRGADEAGCVACRGAPASATARSAAVPTPAPAGAAAAASSPPAPAATSIPTLPPLTAFATSGRPASPRSTSGGAWVAGGLGVALVLALMAQLARARRRVSRRPPP